MRPCHKTCLIILPKLASIPELSLPASTSPAAGTTSGHDLIVSFLSGNTLPLLLIQCPAAWIQDPLSLKTGKLKNIKEEEGGLGRGVAFEKVRGLIASTT